MINSIDEYLLKLKKELSGCDPATVQQALSDSEEHLREAFNSAHDINPDRPDTDVLKGVIKEYGTPDEIAATYRESQAIKDAVMSNKGISSSILGFISTLFTAVYLLGQGAILLFWKDMNADGFHGLEGGYIFFTWALLCLTLGTALWWFAGYVWTSYRRREKVLPLIMYLIPVFPFLAQGTVLLSYWSTRAPGWEQREAETALIMSIISLSLAFILLLLWIWIMVRRPTSSAKVSPVSRDIWRKAKDLSLTMYLFLVFPLVAQSIVLLFYWAADEEEWERIGKGITLMIGLLSLSLALILLFKVIAMRKFIREKTFISPE